jgi:hypothetical protein
VEYETFSYSKGVRMDISLTVRTCVLRVGELPTIADIFLIGSSINLLGLIKLKSGSHPYRNIPNTSQNYSLCFA